MITEEQIQMINELARKSKTSGLTTEEKSKQKELRELYIKSFRENLRSQLENIVLVDETTDMNLIKEKLEQNKPQDAE